MAISMSVISLEDFQKLDIRIGKILKAERIPEKRKIYKLQIDVGTEQIQTIAGGAEYYPPEYFQGRAVVVLLNLQPKVIGGVESRGMLLAADLQGKPVWLTVDQEVPAGTKVR
jgi:methionine--tRNA ligase beta chain